MTRRRVQDDLTVRPSFRTYRVRVLLTVAVMLVVVPVQPWSNRRTAASGPVVTFVAV